MMISTLWSALPIWLDLQSSKAHSKQGTTACFKVRPGVKDFPHFGTLAFTRELLEQQNVR